MIVMFDLMGTLIHDPYRTAYAEAARCTFEEFERARPPEVYHALERGEITEDAYWSRLRAEGLAIDPERFHLLRTKGHHWLPGMRRLVEECAREHRTVIGSNYPVWIRTVEREFLSDLPLDVFASCDLGSRKPAVRFFEEVSRLTGCPPGEFVLVDDKPENTRAFEDFGGRAVVFTSSGRTRDALRTLGVLPPPLPLRTR